MENGSSGRFLITTDNPGCRETVQDGKTGYIYTGGMVADLVNNINQFLLMDNHDRKIKGEIGREYVKNKFSRELVVKEYKKQIRDLIRYE